MTVNSVPELPVRYLLDVNRKKENFIQVRASPLVTEDLLAAAPVTDCVGISTRCLHGNRDQAINLDGTVIIKTLQQKNELISQKMPGEKDVLLRGHRETESDSMPMAN